MLVHELMNSGKADNLAFLDGKKRITYAKLRQAIGFCRNRLYEAGVRRGMRVAVFSRNCVEYVYAYFAIVSLGAIAVPVNFQLSEREVAFIIKNAEIHHIFTFKALSLEAELGDYEGGLMELDIATCGDDSGAPEIAVASDVTGDDLAAIIYTSGTTGIPKGAALTHENLVSNARQYCKVLDVDENDTILCVLPLYHGFSWTCSILGMLLSGAKAVILDTFAPKETVEVIREQEITVLFAVPSICALLTRFAEPEDLMSLRITVIGGTQLPAKIADDFKRKFRLEILEGYGLSECSPIVAVNPPGKVVPGSIGIALSETIVKTVRSDGSETNVGEPGELVIKSPSVMQGYWRRPEATAEVLRDGWLHTGDVARIDADGYIFIVDRIKDMIISMGENIYPREIEEVVYQYPGISEAAVIGIPDKLRGQAGCLCYSVSDGAAVDVAELKKYLRKNLAIYKVPREYREFPELPRTSTGKIEKKVLLDMV